MKKVLAHVLLAFSFVLAVPTLVAAHVTVKPAEVAPGAFQTFTTSVPNEKSQPTTGVRLVIPEGLKHVSPTVKPGWTINVSKSGEGEEATVTQIEWTGGSIGEGLRDEFTFSAQVPASDTTLIWKAYQTYQDGTIVAWDQASSGDSHSGGNPYSQTKVAAAASDKTVPAAETKDNRANIALAISTLALVLTVALPVLRKK